MELILDRFLISNEDLITDSRLETDLRTAAYP